MKFDINHYDDMYVMHCKTEEEADIFLEFLDSLEMMWRDNSSYLSFNAYQEYDDRTCYCFWRGEYCGLDYYKSNEYIVLEFSDFEWDEPLEVSEDDADAFFGFLADFSIV